MGPGGGNASRSRSTRTWARSPLTAPPVTGWRPGQFRGEPSAFFGFCGCASVAGLLRGARRAQLPGPGDILFPGGEPVSIQRQGRPDGRCSAYASGCSLAGPSPPSQGEGVQQTPVGRCLAPGFSPVPARRHGQQVPHASSGKRRRRRRPGATGARVRLLLAGLQDQVLGDRPLLVGPVLILPRLTDHCEVVVGVCRQKQLLV